MGLNSYMRARAELSGYCFVLFFWGVFLEDFLYLREGEGDGEREREHQ